VIYIIDLTDNIAVVKFMIFSSVL